MKENDSYIPKPLHVRPEESKSNIYPFYEVGDEDSKPLGQKVMIYLFTAIEFCWHSLI